LESLNPEGTGAEGFTLLEMIAVLTIIGIMFAILAVKGVDWSQAERIRATEQDVVSCLHSARQAALTRGTAARFQYGAEAGGRGFYLATSDAEGLLGSTNRLASGTAFSEPSAYVEFGGDGRGRGAYPNWTNGTHEVILTNNSAVVLRIAVTRLTGAIEVRRE